MLRTRSVDEKMLVTHAFAADVVPLLAARRVAPVIDSVFGLDQISDAHTRLESNETFGKVVLRMT